MFQPLMHLCILECLGGKWAALAALLVALPSIITALTRYAKATTWRGRLLALLDLLSLLSHRDAHGTMKLPGKRSKPLDAVLTDGAPKS